MNVSLKRPRQQRHPWFRRPRPNQYRAVVADLPMDRPGEAWESLAGALRDLNFTACGSRRRLRCMEPLLQSARFLQASLEAQLGRERFPLSRATDEYVARALEVWSRLAVGYLCALRDLRGNDRGTRHEVALRGLQSLGRLLLNCYHRYSPEPPGTWRAIHEFMEQPDVGEQGAEVPADDSGDATDAITAYKQILVLAATGPLRLRQGEQSAVHRVLAHWARYVSIRPLRDAEPKGPPIVFRPGEDEAPRQYPVDQMPDAPGLRLIDPGPLAGRARHRLGLIEAGDTGSRLSGEFLGGDTLRMLLATWSGASSRRFPRSDNGRASALAVGLEPAWQTIRGQRKAELRCQLVDHSSAGFRAVLERVPQGLIQVGELVAARDRGSWTLGIVRWLRQGEAGGLHVGVEAVSRQPRPIRIRTNGDALRVLLIEENRAAHHPASLITPRMQFQDPSSLVIHETGEPLTLGRLLEATGSLYRFRIEG